MEGTSSKDKSMDLRSLGNDIVNAVQKYIGDIPSEHWSIVIQDVDKGMLEGIPGVRSNYRDTHREIILVLERGNITLISEQFKIEVCKHCGFGKIKDGEI